MNLQQTKTLIKDHHGQFYTYLLKRPDGRPFYVGKGNCKGFRIEKHCKEALQNKVGNKHKINIIRKIWEEGGQIDYEIILFTELEEIAFDKEIELINLYGRRDKETGILANMTDGGEGGSGCLSSEETNRKKSESHKGKISWNKGKPMSEEQKEKISEANKGHSVSEKNRKALSERNKIRPGNNKGKTFSIEHKRKISKSNTGKHHLEETKRKISEANKGHFVSKEIREKISKTLKNYLFEKREMKVEEN